MSTGAYIIIVALALISEKCNSLRVGSSNVVDEQFQNSVLDFVPVQFVETLKLDEEYDELIPEVVEGTKENKKRGVTWKDSGKYEDFAVQATKQRKKRQTHHGYTSLYPQVPSAPPYNSFQPNNPPGQHPAYRPSANSQYPQQWNPNLMNNNPNSGYPSPQAYNSRNTSRPYDPTPGPYGSYNSGYPSHNINSRPSSLPNSQNPYNTTNYPPYSGSGYRPPNTTFHNSSQRPPYKNPGHNLHPVISYNSTYQQPPYNSVQYPSNNNTHPNYSPQWPGVPNNRPYKSPHGQHPQYPNSYPQYSPHSKNSTYNNGPSQRPPYYPGPNRQYPSPNSQYPTTNGYSSSNGPNTRPNSPYPNTNGQYPNSNGQYPNTNSQYHNTNGQYPNTNAQYPNTNGQYHNTNGQYPTSNGQSQGNNNFAPNYPSSNTTTGYRFTNSYSPSIPSYSPRNDGGNNFYYPQPNTTQYDPRKTPPEQFSYHH